MSAAPTQHRLALSARSAEALAARSEEVAALLDGTDDVVRVCRDTHRADAFLPYRLVAKGGTASELRADLKQAHARAALKRPRLRPARIAFLFAGQGVQYPGMGRGLYQHVAAFRSEFDRVADCLSSHGASDVRTFLSTADESALHQTENTQPLVFAFEYALARGLIEWGVSPSVMLGHSLGELVAWCVADAIPIDDACRIVVARAQAMSQIPTEGAMATVFASEADVRACLARYSGKISIAGFNSPTNIAIAGASDALEQCLSEFQSMGVEFSRLKVSFGAHSPLIDPVLDVFEQKISSCTFGAPTVPIVSNVTGTPTTNAPNAAYFRTHAREPVRFSESVKSLESEFVECFLSVAPHPTLLRLARANTEKGSFVSLLERGGDDVENVRNALAALYEVGVNVRWSDSSL